MGDLTPTRRLAFVMRTDAGRELARIDSHGNVVISAATIPDLKLIIAELIRRSISGPFTEQPK